MRVLLLAYPARLRRRHGAELLTTMLELSGERPSLRDRAQLVLDGLRERFRLPPGRPFALAGAVLALVVGGALGAAAGSWAGSWTYPVIRDADGVVARAMGSDVTPGGDVYRDRRWVAFTGTRSSSVSVERAVAGARERLVADGWRATTVRGNGTELGGYEFEAERDGIRFAVRAYERDPLFGVAGFALQPAWFPALVGAGAALGLLGGWLVAAALSYRIAGSRRRRAGTLTAAAGLAALIGPAGSVGAVLAASVGRPELALAHYALGTDVLDATGYSTAVRLSGWAPVELPWWSNLALLVTGIVLLAAAALFTQPGAGRSRQPA